MNVSTISMPREEALAKANAYRNRLRRGGDQEYRVALTAYEALAEGTVLINIQEAFFLAELNENGLPNLAIARADRVEVRAVITVNSTICRFDASQAAIQHYGYYVPEAWPQLQIDVPLSTQAAKPMSGFALLPMVPADVRPKGQLREYYTLWEVEKWNSRPHTPEAPRDPILLKHLTGPLYAVIATWDLTEVERAIVLGRVNRA